MPEPVTNVVWHTKRWVMLQMLTEILIRRLKQILNLFQPTIAGIASFPRIARMDLVAKNNEMVEHLVERSMKQFVKERKALQTSGCKT